jgi:hypothetical protein
MSNSPYDLAVARYLGQSRKRPRWADVLIAPKPKTLGMTKPLTLSDAVINSLHSEFAGNYAYGRLNIEGAFEVLYVGRFDPNCSDRMKHGIGKYPHFTFSYAASIRDAFEKECNNYHDFNPPDNRIHPARPNGTLLKCPHCLACG